MPDQYSRDSAGVFRAISCAGKTRPVPWHVLTRVLRTCSGSTLHRPFRAELLTPEAAASYTLRRTMGFPASAPQCSCRRARRSTTAATRRDQRAQYPSKTCDFFLFFDADCPTVLLGIRGGGAEFEDRENARIASDPVFAMKRRALGRSPDQQGNQQEQRRKQNQRHCCH